MLERIRVMRRRITLQHPSSPPRGLRGVVGNPAQDPVEEPWRVVRRQRLRELDRLRDRHRIVDLVVVEQLVHRDAGQIPVDHRHPLQGPALGVAGQQLVDAHGVAVHALDQLHRVGQVAGLRLLEVGHVRGQDRGPRLAPQVSGVEHVEGPFPGLPARRHLGGDVTAQERTTWKAHARPR